MKLIIDIDEKIYRAVIEDNDMEIVGDNTIELGRAIANGTPISTEGDSISRLELKKAFNKWWGCDDIPATVVEDIIDAAPSVIEADKENGND